MQPKEVPLERNTKDPSSPTASESNSCFTDSGFDVSESRELSKGGFINDLHANNLHYVVWLCRVEW